MRRAILLVAVMIAAVLVASSAVAYAAQSDKAASEKTRSDKTATDKKAVKKDGPVTIENHVFHGWHWARQANDLDVNGEFTLKVGDNVSGSWDSLLDKTIGDWSESTVLNLSKTDGATNPKSCRPTRGQVEVCNWSYGNTIWLGVASVWVSYGHITQGTVKNNDYHYEAKSSYPYKNSMDKLHTICQELGHTIGLGHTSEDGSSQNSCMDYSFNTSEQDTHSTTPNQWDYDQLLCLYDPDPATKGTTLLYPRDSTADTAEHQCTRTGHLDDTTTVGRSAITNKIADKANRPDFTDPKQWGKKIWKSPNGREELWVRDFGGGNLVYNFVILADEEDGQLQQEQTQ